MQCLRSFALLIAGASLLAAQGLSTNATKDDWEEVNFEFNSSVLSDGYPSLLRLAELLHQNADYRVSLDGNTDSVGSNRFNDKLAAARADTVKSFLVKYGAGQNQISVVAHGKRQPKVSNQSKEGRFMNRRVAMTVTDGQGKVVSAGGVGDAIKAMQNTQAAQQKKCCEEILHRLDKLDDILAAIKDLKSENDRLKQDVDALKQAQSGVQKQVAELPHPPEAAELQRMMDTTANNAIEKAKPNRFSLLGLNVGPQLAGNSIPGEPRTSGAGNITLTGKGRYFAPFGKAETSALQAEGEYMYYRDHQEGQFDIGLVNRWNRVQAGLFSSIKHVNLTDLGGGTLGQAAFTADVLFSRGRIGFFGTKSYLTDRVVGRTPTMIPGITSPTGQPVLDYNLLTEYYLRVVDQAGFSTQVGLWNDAYVEGNFGALFRSAAGNRPGGTIRLVQPISSHLAGTLEASLNETMVGSKNNGRVAFGLQFGNWVKPKDFMTVKHPVPVDVPRIRYEVLSRQVRVGHTPPVADAGPDQINVPAGTITLDASGSYSQEGLPLTYAWQQIGGPSVALSGANAVKATFSAAAAQTYQFRVTVTDSLGASATARTTVTTKVGTGPTIVSFTATPTSIKPGESSTLAWTVQNADTVQITSIGNVNPKQGTATVSPTQTTTYTLTASNAQGQVTSVQTVTVGTGGQNGVQIVNFQGNPLTINAGQSSTLTWTTTNADTVTISGVGAVSPNGSTSVSPAQTTTYTLTASNKTGQASASVTITVNSGPTIASFTANPATIDLGQSSTLTWTTQGANTAFINGVGPVATNGSTQVSPKVTTTYVLTVTGQGGAVVTKQATVTVNGGSGQPPVIQIAGGPHIFTKQSQIVLDASASSNPGGGALKFQWSGPANANLVNATTAMPTLIPTFFGDFPVTLTVTNGQGLSSTATILVTFLPSNINNKP